jgi:hypothetical protein
MMDTSCYPQAMILLPAKISIALYLILALRSGKLGDQPKGGTPPVASLTCSCSTSAISALTTPSMACSLPSKADARASAAALPACRHATSASSSCSRALPAEPAWMRESAAGSTVGTDSVGDVMLVEHEEVAELDTPG